MTQKQPAFFLDSGNPEETKTALKLLGRLDGQTTNPTLVLRNPEVASYVAGGKKLTEQELLGIYKKIIQEIEKALPDGHLSVEVNASWESTTGDLLRQAHDMFTWGKKVNIKFPTTPAGVQAAHEFVKEGGRVNMTLVFDQVQAAAVYSATIEARDSVFLSPFVGRWDDRGVRGIDLIRNINRMYRAFDAKTGKTNHVGILSASLRTTEHLMASIAYGADILTIPLKTIQAWVDGGKQMPAEPFTPSVSDLQPIDYQELVYTDDYKQYVIHKREGDLLDEGLRKFAADWQSILV